MFGKSNNPHGQGHNCVLEVTVGGSPDPATGMLVCVAEPDAFVEREALEAYGHKYLNAELPEFATQVPTAENVCREIHGRLIQSPGAGLRRVRVEETAPTVSSMPGRPPEGPS